MFVGPQKHLNHTAKGGLDLVHMYVIRKNVIVIPYLLFLIGQKFICHIE